MVITNRLYPYPVLSPFGDSIVDSEFDIDVSSKVTPERDALILNFTFSLKNRDLKQLVLNESVGVVAHTECVRTAFREACWIPLECCTDVSEEALQGEYNITIPSTQISGKLEICPFLIALKNFTYKNEKFNEYYGDASFEIDVGSILAEGTQKNITVEIARTKLKSQNSIFVTICSENPAHKTISVNIDGDRIKILMPKEMFKSYKTLKGSTANDAMLWSLIIIPAFVSTLEQVRKMRANSRDEFEAITALRWCRSVNKTLKAKVGFEINSDAFAQADMVELAQLIIGNPLETVLNELMRPEETEGEDA